MKKITHASDLIPDENNANKGNVRGMAAVEESLSRYGTGRSVLADKNGKLIAGNTTTNAYLGNGNEKVIVVESDGTELIVVQRVDLDLEKDVAARELAHADNRTNQIGYTPNIDQITADITSGADLGWLWRNDELEAMRGLVPKDEVDNALESMVKPERGGGFQLTVMCKDEAELDRARRELSELGFNFRG